MSVKAILVCTLILAITQGFAYVAEPQATSHSVALAALACLAIQWIAGIPAVLSQTEKYFDFVGSLTYIGVTLGTIVHLKVQNQGPSVRQMALSGCVLVWAIRLGTFLFNRIHAAGKDGRFDEIKLNAARFFTVWNIQGIWCFLTAFPVFVANSTLDTKPLGIVDAVGFAVWIAGFLIEVVADSQKTAFNVDPAHKGKWISIGLWRYSRHPNYFGEVTLWTGVLIVATSTFVRQSQWICLVSPFFVLFLLMAVSGVPMLEKRADAKWGTNVEYQQYKAQTSVLILMPPRACSQEEAEKAARDAEAGQSLVDSRAPAV